MQNKQMAKIKIPVGCRYNWSSWVAFLKEAAPLQAEIQTDIIWDAH